MKKSILIYLKEGLFIFVFMIFSLSTITTSTAPTGSVSIDNSIEYKQLANGNYTVSGYCGNEERIEIPENYQDGTVVSIENKVFEDSNIEEIKLPESIKFLGYKALDTNTLLKIIVNENTSDYYTSILDNNNLGDNAVLIEDGYLEVRVNDGVIDVNNYHYNQKTGSMRIELWVLKQPTYLFEKSVWSPFNGDGSYSKVDDINWLYNDKVYTSDSSLYVEDVSQMDGIFTAEQNNVVLFKIDLNNIKKQETSVKTGDLPDITVGLLIVASACALLILKLVKGNGR